MHTTYTEFVEVEIPQVIYSLCSVIVIIVNPMRITHRSQSINQPIGSHPRHRHTDTTVDTIVVCLQIILQLYMHTYVERTDLFINGALRCNKYHDPGTLVFLLITDSTFYT